MRARAAKAKQIMTKRLMLIGEAPGRPCGPREFLVPSRSVTGTGSMTSADWLIRYTGLDLKDYFRLFGRRNVFSSPVVGPWRDRSARVAGARLLREAERLGLDVVALGRRVAAALGLDRADFLTRYGRGQGYPRTFPFCPAIFVVPHPSGRNRWYNIRSNRERVKEFFKELIL